MKRFTVIAAAALALWTAAGVQARPFEAIQKEGTLRLATEGYYAPFALSCGGWCMSHPCQRPYPTSRPAAKNRPRRPWPMH